MEEIELFGLTVLGRLTIGNASFIVLAGLSCYAHVQEKMSDQEGMFLVSPTKG